MAFVLKQVPARQGAVWVRDGFRTFWQQPLGFFSMLMALYLAWSLCLLLPVIGPILAGGLAPLGSLGFMLGTRAVLTGNRTSPRAFTAPLLTPGTHRRPLLELMVLYALCMALALQLADWADGGALERLAALTNNSQTTEAEFKAAMTDPALTNGMLIRLGLMSLISVPFWHAPVLVLWAGQSVAHALFSSTLAVWRNRGAVVVYTLSWGFVGIGMVALASVMSSALGNSPLTSMVIAAGGLLMGAVFYVSLLFTFSDSFTHRTEAEADSVSS